MPSKPRFQTGSLLGPVQPLPDDDEEPTPPPRKLAAAPEPRKLAAAPEPRKLAAAPEPREREREPEPPTPVARPTPAPAPEPEPAPPEETPAPDPAASAPPRAAEGSRRRQGPPATLRVNDVAGRALWDAFLVEKAQDPFLSYREFVSRVVLAGLGKEKRRRR